MSRIITLTTDFGQTDAFVGIMKGAILSIASQVTIVDLTHQIPPQDVAAAAFALYQAAHFFPSDTIHVSVVDPGVGSARRAVAVNNDLGLFLAPDNGLLTPFLETGQIGAARCLTNPAFHLSPTSSTFHGRDIFAPAAAHLANGAPFVDLGEPVDNLQRLGWFGPQESASEGMVCRVLHIDRFGNLVLDVTREQLPQSVSFHLAGQSIFGLRSTFSDVKVGELVAYSGSTRNHVEIGIRNGNAARSLGMQVGDQVEIGKERQ